MFRTLRSSRLDTARRAVQLEKLPDVCRRQTLSGSKNGDTDVSDSKGARNSKQPARLYSLKSCLMFAAGKLKAA